MVSYQTIDEYIWKVEWYLAKKYGVDASYEISYPLKWYVILTGRATTDFLKGMLEVKPYVIGRILYNNRNDSTENIIEKIKKKVLKMC